jgi:cysteinyl-tRNA synthetase
MVANIRGFVIKSMVMIKLYNTLFRKKQNFRPLYNKRVGLYTCGPTVYDFSHIGNLRTYIFEDVLRRVLEYNGYKVKHIMNITDVGHLTSDADLGEDKIEKSSRQEGKSVQQIAEFYTRAFLNDLKKLNIKKAHKLAPATRYIKQQINLISRLFKKGYAYETSRAVYFDVLKFKNYTKLSKQKLSQKIIASRQEVIVDPEKRNPYDFALWFKTVGRFKNHILRWPSSWGIGFPGWHLECSAISSSELGQPFDIHVGGVDHINVHHTNEIAQSEGAFGKPLARFWLHGEFLLVNQSKMAKSESNFLTLETIIKKGFNPLTFRYLVLTSHYRSKLNFTWKSLEAAQNALNKLYEIASEIASASPRSDKTKKSYEVQLRKILRKIRKIENNFLSAINDDLDTPKALSIMWQIIKDNRLSSQNKKQLLLKFDKVLGLGLEKIKPLKIPPKIKNLVAQREKLRTNKQFIQSDRLRKRIEKLGYIVEDTKQGPFIRRRIRS